MPKRAKTLGRHIRRAGGKNGPSGSLESRKTSRKRCFSAFPTLRPSRERSRPAKELQKTCPGPALTPVSQSRSVSWGPPAQENPPQYEENTTFRLFSSFSGRQNPARPAQGLPKPPGLPRRCSPEPGKACPEPLKAGRGAQGDRPDCPGRPPELPGAAQTSVSSAKQSNDR